MALGGVFRNIEDYPSLLKIVCPDYVRGAEAMKRIDNGETLYKGDEGFDVLSNIFLRDYFFPMNPNLNNKLPSLLIVDNVRLDVVAQVGFIKTSYVRFAMAGIGVNFLGGGNEFPIEEPELKTKLEALKHTRLFRMGRTLLVFGLFIELSLYSIDLIAYAVARSNTTKKTT